MKLPNILQTFFSRFLVLILNFGLLIFTTRFWGSEGKGAISIVIADLTAVTFFCNIFVGSSTTFFARRFPKEQVLASGYLWAILSGVVFSFFLSFITPVPVPIGYLIALSVFFSLFSANINLFLGYQDLKKFNIYTLLQIGLHIIFIWAFIFIFRFKNVELYFQSQILCYAVLFLASGASIIKNSEKQLYNISSWNLWKEMFSYGWKTQLSAFLQFLNQRLSFYLLEFFTGIASVGIFSVGIAFSEAAWVISNSLCVVLYANLVNEKNQCAAISETKTSLKLSVFFTLLFIILILLTPADVFTNILGKDFNETKKIIILLSPGILAIAASNILGHYFSANKELNILNIKSLAGLVCNISLGLFFIPKLGVFGASIATSLSYMLSSSILFVKFYRRAPFRLQDFFITRADILNISTILQRKK